jgi:PAS domain S-box-containing protein
VGLRLAINPYVTGVQFITFFPAVIGTAYVVGQGPALLTAMLCGLAGWYLLIPPVNSFRIEQTTETFTLLAYFLTAGAIALLVGRVRGAVAREHAALGALYAGQARARRALDSISEGFVLLDRDFRVLDVNAEGMRLEARPREAILGRTHWQAWPGSEASELGQLYKTAMTDRVPVKLVHRYVWPDGRDAWLDMRAYPTDEGLAVFYRDITDEHIARERLRSVELRLNAVLDNASVSIFLMNERQHCIYMNAAAERLTGYKLEETLGRPLHDVIHHTRPDGSPFPLEECAIDRAFPENNNMQGEEVFVHKDGRFYPVAYTASPIRDKASRTVGTIIEVQDITQRKHAEQALRESEAEARRAASLLEAIGNSSPSLIYAKDRDCRLIYANPAALAIFGKTAQEVMGRTAGEIAGVHAEGDAHSANDRIVMASGQVQVLEEVYTTGDGVTRTFRSAKGPLRLSDGSIAGVVGVSTDVTDQLAVQNALRDSQERLDLAVRAHRVGIYDWFMQTGRLVWSEQQEILAGLPPGSFEGTIEAWQKRVVPEDLAAFTEQTAAAIANHQEHLDFTYRLIRSDGEIRHMEGAARILYAADGSPERMVGTNIDATERKRSELELKRLNETLEQRVAEALAERKLWADVFESSDALIGALGPDHCFLALNKAYADEFERIYGVRPQVGDCLGDLLADRPEHRKAALAIWDRALSGEEFTVTEEFGDEHRARPAYELRFNPLHDRDGRPIGAFQYAVDVSDRLRSQAQLAQAQDALRQSQKMESLGQLTGGIAHDFNNLLTGIIGSLDLLERRVALGRTENLERYTTTALASARRAAAMTQRLLAFSRRQALDPKAADLNKLVQAMEDLIRRSVGEQVTLETVLAGGLWVTKVDRNQLENALLNLCVNARDAMPEGGRLTIETSNGHLDAAYAARNPDVRPGQYVVLSVTDTGMGMPPDVVERAFEPFYTTKPLGKGTGLGLSQLHGFVKQSGGHVAIYSEVGQGTAVKVYLPRHYGAAEEEEVTSARELARAEAQEAVLVVEDEDTVRMLVVDVLDELAYRAYEAVDPKRALFILETDARIDLLITDVGLPGMNGRQLADRARELRPGLKVLFITGYAHNAAVGNGLLEPGMEVVTKPFAIDQLAAKISEMISR